MKRQLTYLFATVLLLSAGCSKNEQAEGAKGLGEIRIDCAANGDLATRADISAGGPIPSGSDFSLRITGEEYDRNWQTVAAFGEEEVLVPQGDYTAAISWGDPEAEGYDKPHYKGTVSFPVLPRQTNEVSITATLANAQALVRTTPQFREYFHDAHFTVTTGSAHVFDYAFASTDGAPDTAEPVFVQAATSLQIAGTARRQSSTGQDSGKEVKFAEQRLESTLVRTRHTFEFDAADAGSATLKIYIGVDENGEDLLVETVEIPVELNDGAIKD